MAKAKPRGSRLRRFYDEHVAFPLGYSIFATVITSTMFFFMTWAGRRGGLHPWGDPIPFTEALAKVPEMAVVSFVVAFVLFLIFRIRF